jgi:integrase
MASVRLREWTTRSGCKRSSYVVTYLASGKRTRKQGFARKKDALAYLQQVEDELRHGIHVPNRQAVTFRVAAEAWLDECRRRNRVGEGMGGGRLDSYEAFVENHLPPEFGVLKITQIDSPMVDKYIKAKGEEISSRTGRTYSRATLRALRNILSLIMQRAVQARLGLVRNPLKDDPVIIAEGEEEEVVIPELTEIRALLEVLAAPRQVKEPEDAHRARMLAVVLAVFCGLRRGEICALQWPHVRLAEWNIDVRQSYSKYDGLKGPKTRAGRRTVPMNPIVHHLLSEHAQRHDWPASGWVLRNKNGAQLHPDNVTGYHWPKIARAAGLVDQAGAPRYTFHHLRHAAGSLWLADGMNLEDVSRLLGHSNVSTTWRIYAHKMAHDDRAVRIIHQVGARFGGVLPESTPPVLLPPPPPFDVTPVEIDVTPVEIEDEPVTTLSGLRQHQQRQLIENAKRGMPLIENSQSVGIGQPTAVKWLEQAGLHTVIPRKRTQVEQDARERALAMWQDGVPVRLIAKEIGVTERCIRNWAGDAGLTRTPYSRPGIPTLGARRMREFRLRQKLAAQK